MKKFNFKRSLLSVLTIIGLALIVIVPLKTSYAAGEHQFSLKLYDWNPLEETGTNDEYTAGDQIDPGRVVKVDVYYVPGSQTDVSMQIGIKYDKTLVEPILDGTAVYFEMDESTTYNGGIWPAQGTIGAKKNKTNWFVQANDDSANSMLKMVIKDSQLTAPLVTEGVLVSYYFQVKDDAPAGSTLSFDIDSNYTRMNNKSAVSTSGIDLSVYGEMSNDVSLSTLTLTGNNGLNYPCGFTAGTTTRTFEITVPNAVTTVTIQATPTDTNATILASGLGSKPVTVGNNTFNFTVQSQDLSQEIYTIKVKRLNNDTKLKTLSLSGATLDYELSDGIYTYTATVPFKKTSTSINATTNDSNATLTGTGAFNLTNTGTTLNTATINVKAEDCKSQYNSVPGNTCTEKNYTVNVTRTAPSSNTDLSSISIDGTPISGFSSSQTTYTLANVANNKTSVLVEATLADSLNTVSGTGTKSLAVGDNAITLTVTAEDNSTKTYTINIRRLNNNGYLKTLTITPTPSTASGTLSPSFTKTFLSDYTYRYDPEVTNINVYAEVDHSTATIISGTGNFAPGTAGTNVVVQAEDGTQKIYVIKFERKKSRDAKLKSLSIDGVSLNETFSPETTMYTASVAGTVASVNVNAEANDTKATSVTGTGSKSLIYGANTIKVTVTAEDTTVTKDYYITVTRNRKTISSLADLKVDGTTVSGFNSAVQTYDLGTVPFTKDTITISATPTDDPDATVTGVGTKSLTTGSNTFNVIVTAHDGTSTTTYTLTVFRTRSDNAYLASLAVTGRTLDQSFNKETTSYTLSVPYEVTSVTVTATPEYAAANAVIGGPTTLSVGDNNYTISVTAEDGNATKVYNLKVTRLPSTNKLLSALSVVGNSTEYIQVFSSNTKTYNITVPNDVTSVNITATGQEPANQTITGTGTKPLNTGLNTFEVVVKAADNSEGKYTLNITRDLNSNDYLSSLEVVDYNISPAFNKNTLSYTLTVPSSVDKIRINGAVEETGKSTVTGLGEKTLTTGPNTFNIVVTAENNSKKTYVIVVTKQASNDSSLKSLTIQETLLNENFASGTLNYTANVANSVTKINVSAIANDSKAKSVTGTGEKTLNTGDNTISIVVTAEDNTQTTYTIVVNRAKNTNADLTSIGINGGFTLDPAFDKDTTNYSLTVPNSTKKVLITTTKAVLTSTVTGDGEVNLNTGDNTINIVVQAEDPNVSKTYTIVINRTKSSDKTLKALTSTDGTITPNFDPAVKSYSLDVNYEVVNANLVATPNDSAATAIVSGNTNLSVGNNTATITVTAEDGSTGEYTVTIKRQPSSNNYLSSLSIKDLTNKEYITAFNKNQSTYTIEVANDVQSLDIDATAEDSGSTVKYTGTKTLVVGSNSFTIECDSASGVPRNYTINVTRAKNSNAKLSSLAVTDQTLVPDFDPDTISYNFTVDSTVDEVTIEATAEVSTSTVSGTGTKSLHTGVNQFSVVVTAEDTTVTKTYVITINRTASDNNYLKSLSTSLGLNKVFDKEDLTYSLEVPNGTTDITIEAEADADSASLTGTGTFPLSVGNNSFLITVTAEDNTFRVYTIEVNREASDNNFLSDLRVDNSTISGFNKNTLSYTLSVGNEVTELNVEGIAEDSTAVVTGNKIWYLNTGDNGITIVVTSEKGNARTYTINVNRAKSSNNYLSNLSALEGALTPSFNKETSNYTMSVPYEITSLTLTTMIEDATANVEVEGNVDFQIGSDNTVTVTVVAEDSSTRTYTINVTRLKQANNFLTDLTVTGNGGKTYSLSPSFEKNTLNYSLSVDKDDRDLVISGTKEVVSSTVTGFETIHIDNFPYTHSVVVTSAGGVPRTYTLNISYTKSNNNNLKSISLSDGTLSPDFSENITSYTVNVPSEVNSININAEGYPGSSIAGTGSHILNQGDNTINLTVTAEDGTSKNYVITVNRAEATLDAKLSSINLTGAMLIPSFNQNTFSYVAEIGAGTSSVVVSAVPNDSNATVKWSLNNGAYQEDSSITVSNVNMMNVVTIKVENGTETNTYTVRIMPQQNATNNATLLRSLQISEGTLTPSFNPRVNNYTVTVPYDVKSVLINAEAEVGSSTINPSNSFIRQLNVGTNAITIEVDDNNGSVGVYVVTITREDYQGEATLGFLNVTGGDITPRFDKNTFEYILLKDASTDLDISYAPSTATGVATISVDKGAFTDISNVTDNQIREADEIDIKVVDGSESNIYHFDLLNKFISSNRYGHTISRGYVFMPKLNVKTSDFVTQFDNKAKYLKLYESDGTTPHNNGPIGTGMKLKLVINGQVYDELTTVLFGDVDGNGIIDVTDVLRVVNHIIGGDELKDSSFMASDIINNNEIEVNDALRIINHIIGEDLLYSEDE